MLIYNVTIKVNRSIHDEWLKWLKEEHIPDLVGTGCFTNAVVLHLLEADDEEGITYAVQYHAPSPELYEKYISEYADEMRNRGHAKWGNQFIAFRTLMRLVD